MAILRFAGRLSLWAIAALLWLVVLFAITCMVWFNFFGPEEERMVASIWGIIMLMVGTPALLLTARLGGFWHRLFPEH
ncbi:MAG: hypothetical protein WD557_08650 [Dehalococcoidia bacterium]